MSHDHEYPNQMDCLWISEHYIDWVYGDYTYIPEYDNDNWKSFEFHIITLHSSVDKRIIGQ